MKRETRSGKGMVLKLGKYKLYEWMVALCVFVNGLGFVVYISGINIVNIFSVMAAMAIIMDMTTAKNFLKHLLPKKKLFFLVFFCTWVLYAMLQACFSDFSQEEYQIVFRQLATNTIFVCFIGYTIHDNKSFHLLEKAMIGVLAVNVALGMFEVLTGIHFIEPESIWDAESARAFSINPNEYATTVYCSLVCVVFSIFRKRFGWKEAVIVLLSLVCIFTSHSRAILYAVVIYALAYVFFEFYYRMGGKAFLIKSLTIMSMAVLGILVIQNLMPKLIGLGIEFFSGRGDYVSDFYRLSLIEGGLRLFADTHGFGVGAGQSIYLLKMNPHNFFVEILAEYGIVIFAGIIFIMWSIWKRAFDVTLPRHIRCVYFSWFPSMAMASISSSSINKFKIFWVMIFMFYLSKDYLIETGEKKIRRVPG